MQAILLEKGITFIFIIPSSTSLLSPSSSLQFSVQGRCDMCSVWTSPTGAAAPRACLRKPTIPPQRMWVVGVQDPMPQDREDVLLVLIWVPGKASWKRGSLLESYGRFLRAVTVPLCFCIDTAWPSRRIVTICRENKWRVTLFWNLTVSVETLMLCICHTQINWQWLKNEKLKRDL